MYIHTAPYYSYAEFVHEFTWVFKMCIIGIIITVKYTNLQDIWLFLGIQPQ